MTLGSNWAEKIKDVPKQSNDDRIKDKALGIAEKNEITAEDYFENIKPEVLPAAIGTSIDKGQDALMLAAPMSIIDTDAFQNFKNWAKENGLHARIYGILTENFAKGNENSIALNIMPMD